MNCKPSSSRSLNQEPLTNCHSQKRAFWTPLDSSDWLRADSQRIEFTDDYSSFQLCFLTQKNEMLSSSVSFKFIVHIAWLMNPPPKLCRSLSQFSASAWKPNWLLMSNFFDEIRKNQRCGGPKSVEISSFRSSRTQWKAYVAFTGLWFPNVLFAHSSGENKNCLINVLLWNKQNQFQTNCFALWRQFPESLPRIFRALPECFPRVHSIWRFLRILWVMDYCD